MRRGASSLRRTATGLALSASLLLSAGISVAQASPEETAAARALATQGSEALKKSRFAEALDLVSRAEALLHAPTHLLMIARAEAGLGKLVDAQETYLKLLHEELRADAPTAFKNAQSSARDELAAIEPKIASLRIAIDGAGQKSATVKLDDVPVPAALLNVYRPVDPGPHVVAVYPAGQSPVKGSVDLHEGERKDIRLTIPNAPPPPAVPVNPSNGPDATRPGPIGANPQQPPRDSGSSGFFTPLRGVGLALTLVGVAGAVAGAILIPTGFSDQSKANTTAQQAGCTGPGFTQCPSSTLASTQMQLSSLDQDAANFKTIGTIALPVGVAALGAGVALLVVGKPASGASTGAAPSRVTVAPWFGGASAGVRGRF